MKFLFGVHLVAYNDCCHLFASLESSDSGKSLVGWAEASVGMLLA